MVDASLSVPVMGMIHLRLRIFMPVGRLEITSLAVLLLKNQNLVAECEAHAPND